MAERREDSCLSDLVKRAFGAGYYCCHDGLDDADTLSALRALQEEAEGIQSACIQREGN